jgi:hypothetical protein
MAYISDIQADKALQSLLVGKVFVQTSDTDSSVLDVYANYERPNVGLSDEFVSCYYNGNIQSRTKPLGLFFGNLAVSVFCKANADNTAKKTRIKQLVKQVEMLVHRKTVYYEGIKYYFEITPTPITPTTVSTTTGYATTVLNVEWHTNQ